MLKKRFMSSLSQKKDTMSFNSWIIKNQKGISTIVATLIIILLVLVAAGIIWVVVKGIVQEGAEGIELGRLTLDLEIKKAQIENGNVTIVVVRRNPGQGNFVGMNFVFSDGINSEIIRENTTLQELEEKSFTFTLTEISTDNLQTISVAPTFELSSGKESVGDIVDSFDVSEEMRAGITGGAVGNFAALGYSGAGKMEYGPFSSDTPKLPEFKKAIVDPLDVLPGDNQTFTTHVYSPYEIIEVTSVTELDNSILNLGFEKIDEYVEDNETIEIWSASWIVNDTHTTEYRTTVTAIDSEGNSNSITLTWTDSCQSQITHGQDITLSTSCSTGVSAIAGLDGGNLTINSGITLIIDSDATWAFNDGKSITPTGSISMGGGSIKKGNLFYTDADGDYYAPSSTLVFSTSSSLSGKIRASSGSLLGTTDCNDGDAARWYNRYTDSDSDTYCPSSSLTCVGTHSGYRDSCTTFTDCNDGDADVYQNVANMILDGDQDRYSTGSSATRCVGAKSSYWYKDADGTYKWISTSDDLGTSDCNDADSTRWYNRYDDTDGDTYCQSSTLYCVGTHSGYRDSCTTFTDCNDDAANVWRNRYRDGDGDTHCPSSTLYCVGDHAGYRDSCTRYDDCHDGDANIYVGQTSYFTTPNIGGNYDYNCDSVETKQWTITGGCHTCIFTDICEIKIFGGLGWDAASAPACGVSGWYITNEGECIGPSGGCTNDNCISESRTQACR